MFDYDRMGRSTALYFYDTAVVHLCASYLIGAFHQQT